MSNVGLLYVGAILIVNGIMLLGVISARATVPLNLFVGTMQVVIPTVMMVTAHGDGAVIADAGGLYLFGFTYLWVGINGATGWPAEGLGWFSLFVAFVAVGYAAHTWAAGGRIFVVIWLAWAALWLLFFLVLGLGRAELTRFTGAVAVAQRIRAQQIFQPQGLLHHICVCGKCQSSKLLHIPVPFRSAAGRPCFIDNIIPVSCELEQTISCFAFALSCYTCLSCRQHSATTKILYKNRPIFLYNLLFSLSV